MSGMVAAARYPGLVDVTLAFPPASVLGQREALDGLSLAWLADLALQGRSPSTLRAYRGDLLAFIRWGRRHGLEHWQHATDAQLAAFLAAEHGREVSLRLLTRRIGTIRGLFQFGRLRGHNLPAPRVRPRYGAPLAVTVEPDVIAKVIRSCRGPDFFAVRDRAVLEILYGTGVTSSECCALDLDHLDLAASLVRVEARYRTPRRVPLSQPVLEALRAWLAIRRSVQVHGSHLALFTTAGGYRLTQDALATLVTRRSISVGVVPPLTPRALRNSFGVHLFEGGADEAQVAALMGISFVRAEDLHRSTDPHRRRVGAALRALTDRRDPSKST